MDSSILLHREPGAAPAEPALLPPRAPTAEDCRALLISPENDPDSDRLEDYLRDSGLHLERTHSVPHGPVVDVDVVVLAATLPDVRVWTFLCVQAEGGAPVMILANRAESVERILALELGAADVIDRTVAKREVLARLRAVVRRRPVPALTAARGCVAAEPWLLDPRLRSLRAPSGHVLSLSARDVALLMNFVRKEGDVVSREDDDGGLRTAVSRLVRRAWREARLELPIRNVRGRGYCFTSPLLSAF